MLSRVAQNIYWLARYTERAENTARLISASSQLQLDLPKAQRPGWEPLIAITGSAEAFAKHYNSLTEANVVHFLVGDDRNPGSIVQNLHWARENARSIREFLPREGWQQLNEVFAQTRDGAMRGQQQRNRHDYVLGVIKGVHAFNGLLAGTMSHDAGYSFLRIGRCLERADMTSRIIDVRAGHLQKSSPTHSNTYESIQWMSILSSLSGLQMYQREMQQVIGWTAVLNFLLKDRNFPRAFNYSVAEVALSLSGLANHQPATEKAEALMEKVSQLNPAEIDAPTLHAIIDDLQLELAQLNSLISETYFA